MTEETNCERCTNEVGIDEIGKCEKCQSDGLCPDCLADGLCPDCLADHNCRPVEDIDT